MSNPDFSEYLAALSSVPPVVMAVIETQGSSTSLAEAPEGGFDVTTHVGEHFTDIYCLTVHTNQKRKQLIKVLGSGLFVLTFNPASGKVHTDANFRTFTVYEGTAQSPADESNRRGSPASEQGA